MKRKLYFMVGCILMMQATNAMAQCTGGRYVNEIFSSTMSTVTYSTPYSLQMDIYQPAGDTLSARPVIILAHEGTFIGGTRNSDPTVDTLCARFARRGYVTVSIDYRLASGLTAMFNLDTAANEVAKAMSDGKAAIRYMVANRTTYKIDTNNIFIGGNSAGAVLYMHVGYINSAAECDPLVLAAMNANGGFDGNSGNPGYTTLARGVINLAGALHNVVYAGPGDVASVNCQGDLDNVVPYNCGKPLSGLCPDSLCGLGSLEAQYNSAGIYHLSRVFTGQSHVPWDADAGMLNSVDSVVKLFLSNIVCTGVLSVNETVLNTEVSLYPNPATEVVNISASAPVSEVSVYDQTGRTAMMLSDVNSTNCELNTSHLSKGLYFVKIRFGNDNNTPVVKRIFVD